MAQIRQETAAKITTKHATSKPQKNVRTSSRTRPQEGETEWSVHKSYTDQHEKGQGETQHYIQDQVEEGLTILVLSIQNLRNRKTAKEKKGSARHDAKKKVRKSIKTKKENLRRFSKKGSHAVDSIVNEQQLCLSLISGQRIPQRFQILAHISHAQYLPSGETASN